MRRLPRTAYRMRYACFDCRKSFAIKNHTRAETIVCPQCGKPMSNMGVNFKAPRQSDKKQWRKVEILRLNGFRFSGYGEGHKPQRLNQVDEFLAKMDKRRK